MDFRAWFRSKLGGDFPLELDRALVRVESFDGDVFASEEIRPSLQFPPMVPEFREDIQEYVLAGIWGRSLNTFAFYYVEKRGSHRRFFRIAAGGVYGDFEKEAAAVRKYLAGYEAWREAHEARFAASTLTHNLGIDHAELTGAGGRVVVQENFDEETDWWAKLAI